MQAEPEKCPLRKKGLRCPMCEAKENKIKEDNRPRCKECSAPVRLNMDGICSYCVDERENPRCKTCWSHLKQGICERCAEIEKEKEEEQKRKRKILDRFGTLDIRTCTTCCQTKRAIDFSTKRYCRKCYSERHKKKVMPEFFPVQYKAHYDREKFLEDEENYGTT